MGNKFLWTNHPQTPAIMVHFANNLLFRILFCLFSPCWPPPTIPRLHWELMSLSRSQQMQTFDIVFHHSGLYFGHKSVSWTPNIDSPTVKVFLSQPRHSLSRSQQMQRSFDIFFSLVWPCSSPWCDHVLSRAGSASVSSIFIQLKPKNKDDIQKIQKEFSKTWQIIKSGAKIRLLKQIVTRLEDDSTQCLSACLSMSVSVWTVCLVFRDGWHHQNGWIFGKIPNGLWPPPHFRKIILRILRQNCDKSAYVHYGGTVVYYMILFPMRCM